jgi:hypothetical protein
MMIGVAFEPVVFAQKPNACSVAPGATFAFQPTGVTVLREPEPVKLPFQVV